MFIKLYTLYLNVILITYMVTYIGLINTLDGIEYELRNTRRGF